MALWTFFQLPLNAANGLTDAVCGLYNIAAYLGNSGLYLGSLGFLSKPIPYIPDWDWSRNLVVQESDELHDWSKLIASSAIPWAGAQKMSIALIRSSNARQKIHFAYKVEDKWYDALLLGPERTMRLRDFASKEELLRHWSPEVTSVREAVVPILFPKFAAGTQISGPAPFNCLTAAVRAWFSGGGAIFPAIPLSQLAPPPTIIHLNESD